MFLNDKVNTDAIASRDFGTWKPIPETIVVKAFKAFTAASGGVGSDSDDEFHTHGGTEPELLGPNMAKCVKRFFAIELTEEEMESTMILYDLDRSGSLSQDEFITMMRNIKDDLGQKKDGCLTAMVDSLNFVKKLKEKAQKAAVDRLNKVNEEGDESGADGDAKKKGGLAARALAFSGSRRKRGKQLDKVEALPTPEEEEAERLRAGSRSKEKDRKDKGPMTQKELMKKYKKKYEAVQHDFAIRESKGKKATEAGTKKETEKQEGQEDTEKEKEKEKVQGAGAEEGDKDAKEVVEEPSKDEKASKQKGKKSKKKG
eukprot:g6632.t1